MRAASAARVPTLEIARRLRRPADAVRRRRELLGVARPPGRRYRADEDAALAIVVAEGGSLAELAAQLGRTEDALRLRARTLGLTDGETRRRWSPAEDDRLRFAYASGLATKQIQQRQLPERTTGAIVARAHLLGLAVNARRWTPGEESRLRLLVAGGASAGGIGRELGRSEEAIRNRCRRLGVGPPISGRRAPPRRWTAGEDRLLRARDADPPALLADVLGRTPAAIRRRRRQLQLAGTERSQHHPLRGLATSHTEKRLITRQLPLTPTRALALSRRLGVPLSQIQIIAQQIDARANAYR